MMVARPPENQLMAEKTLYDVLRDIWAAKFFMLGFAVMMVLAAFIFLSLSHNFYQAEMIIAPASPMGSALSEGAKTPEGTIQTQQGDFQSNAAFLRFENIYDGTSVASFLVQDKDIVAAFALDRAFTFSEGRTHWDAQSLSEYLKKKVRLEPISGTPLRRLTYMHTDKLFAVDLIKRGHRITDEMIRARILVETNQRIDYLNASIVKTTNPDHRRTLAGLLMEQERLKMMVSLDQPYAASVIEPAYVSARPRWPDPYVIYSVFILIGLLFGFVTYGLRHHA